MTANDKFQTRIMARAMRQRGPDRRYDFLSTPYMRERGPDRRRALEHYTAQLELAKAQERIMVLEEALKGVRCLAELEVGYGSHAWRGAIEKIDAALEGK